MDKKRILISSVVIALAATMLFATIATPALAAKKFEETKTSMSFDAPASTCPEGDMIHLDIKQTIKKWDNGKMLSKQTIKVYFFVEDTGKRTGQGQSINLDNFRSADLPHTILSKVTTTCNGEGLTNHFLHIKHIISEDLTVEHQLS